MSTDGLFNINKPSGITSFQVVARVRRWSGERRVGHGGTLDPLATGVLPVALGRATRLLEYLLDTRKRYHAQIELGKTTDTYDAEGKLTSVHDPLAVTQAQLEAALAHFRGTLEQTPPPYSAVRHQGRHLYELSRAGIKVEVKPRKTEVFHLELVSWQMPHLTLDIECSKGTYIRSIAHDLGQVLGCGAFLKSLVRTGSGPFHLEAALSLEQLENAFRQEQWRELLLPPDFALSHWNTVVLDKTSEQAVATGQNLPLSLNLPVLPAVATTELTPIPTDRCRAYSQDGRFLGVLRLRQDIQAWHPEKLLL